MLNIAIINVLRSPFGWISTLAFHQRKGSCLLMASGVNLIVIN